MYEGVVTGHIIAECSSVVFAIFQIRIENLPKIKINNVERLMISNIYIQRKLYNVLQVARAQNIRLGERDKTKI